MKKIQQNREINQNMAQKLAKIVKNNGLGKYFRDQLSWLKRT